MRVLVTGSTGHVGGAIARHLFENGHEVAGIGTRKKPTPFRQLLADISHPAFIEETQAYCEPCEAVIHCAATIEESPSDPLNLTRVNCVGTQAVLTLAQRWKARHFLYISSLHVVQPAPGVVITEEQPTSPPTAYHASKLFGEQLVKSASVGEGGLHAASFRISSPIGPGLTRKRIFSAFVRQAALGRPIILAGHGGRIQNYVDARDIATAVKSFLESKAAGIFNIAGAASISNLDLARTCLVALNSGSRIEFNGQTDAEEHGHWLVSIEKAGERLGWRPIHTLENSARALALELDTP